MKVEAKIRHIKIDVSRLKAKLEVSRAVRVDGRQKVEELAVAAVEKHKKELIKDFNRHIVTKELGEKRKTSSLLGGKYGNLFSYVGFPAGTDPASEIREFLRESIVVQKGKTRKVVNQIAWRVKIDIPSLKDFAEANIAKMPWLSGTSFVEEIEKGIPGFQRYLYLGSTSHGFSKQALQVAPELEAKLNESGKTKRRGLQQPKSKYMSTLLNSFEAKLRRSIR